MQIFFDVFVAVLAVFGGYSALKLLSERCLTPRRFRPAIALHLDGSEDDELIAAMAEGAGAMWVHSRRLVILTPPAADGGAAFAERVSRLCPGAEIVETASRSGEE